MTHRTNISEIETEHLYLVPLEEIDLELFNHLYSDNFLTKNIGGKIEGKKIHKSFILSLRNNTEEAFSRFTWSIVAKTENQKIGICGLVSNNVNASSADIGTVIKEPYHGRGIATESLRGLMKYGFESLKLEEINGNSFFRNKISFKLMKSLGYQFETTEIGESKGYFWYMTDENWQKAEIRLAKSKKAKLNRKVT